MPLQTARTLAVLIVAGLALSSVLPLTASADPPDWAPAWGYRGKHHKYKHSTQPVYVIQPYPYYVRPESYPIPYGIDTGSCNRAAIGAVLGGAAGGVVGSQVAGHDDRAVGIVAGTLIGALFGGLIGDAMDRADYACMGQAFEYVPDGRPVTWRDPNGRDYRVIPDDSYQTGDGRYCRKYATSAVVDGRTETVTGTACREPDGSWRLGG